MALGRLGTCEPPATGADAQQLRANGIDQPAILEFCGKVAVLPLSYLRGRVRQAARVPQKQPVAAKPPQKVDLGRIVLLTAIGRTKGDVSWTTSTDQDRLLGSRSRTAFYTSNRRRGNTGMARATRGRIYSQGLGWVATGGATRVSTLRGSRTCHRLMTRDDGSRPKWLVCDVRFGKMPRRAL